jgi:hypothetical protein
MAQMMQIQFGDDEGNNGRNMMDILGTLSDPLTAVDDFVQNFDWKHIKFKDFRLL